MPKTKDTTKVVKAKTKTKAKAKVEVVEPKILTPRLSEKAVDLGNVSIYTFNIPAAVGKIVVRAEFIKAYKLTPRRINIIRQGQAKKAVVYLKAGEKIDFV